MEALSKRQEAVLDVLDDQIEELEAKLAKVQPLIDELNRLRATRRTLLSQSGTTSGGGNAARAQLTMEEVVRFMHERHLAEVEGDADDGETAGVTPQQISEALGVSGSIVRAHLSRHKDKRYQLVDGLWYLTENSPEED